MKRFLLLISLFIPVVLCAEEEYFSAEAIRSDFHELYRGLLEAQYDPFHQISAEELEQRYQELASSINSPQTLREVSALFQRFTALTETAHTRVEFPIDTYQSYLQNDGKTLSLYLEISSDDVVIDDYFGAEPELYPGVKLIAVDGLPVRQWLDRYAALVAADNQQLKDVMLGMQLQGMLWWADGARESYEITIMAEDGSPVTVSAMTTSYDEQALLANASQAEVQEQPLRDYQLLTPQVGYVKPGPFYNAEGENPWDTEPFKRWVDEAFNSLIAADAEYVVIDLRSNPGGSNSFSDHLVAWFADQAFAFASDFRVRASSQAREANLERLALTLDETDISHRYETFFAEKTAGEIFSFPLDSSLPRDGTRFEGEVIALIDETSFSNAVSVAAIIQDYGFGTLIGQKTADLATTYGAMEHFRLSETNLQVGFPKALIIRPNGDSQPDGVTPDVRIQSHEDVLAAALEWIEGERSRKLSSTTVTVQQ